MTRDLAALAALTATEMVAARAAGRVAAGDLLEACVEAVARTEPAIRAWAIFDPGLEPEPVRDDSPTTSGDRPLDGVPIGVKDVVDVRGFPTVAGFAPFAGRTVSADAPVVARLRSAGAVVVGKTSTAQFAYRDPPLTRNPWAADRTPGGSSSGSAAAVAARHVPMAVATQTGGSILRPAAYTGVVGFKPTFGLVPVEGVVPLAPSLDHVGVIARSVQDCRLFLQVTAAETTEAARMAQPGPPRLLVATEVLERCSRDVRDDFDRALAILSGDGARIGSSGSLGLDELLRTQRVIMQVEATSLHTARLDAHGDDYGPLMRAFVESGRLISPNAYREALSFASALRADLARAMDGWDGIVLPTVPAVAPSFEATGDASLLAPFSLARTPTISLPSGLASDGLPLGIQLVGHVGSDLALLAAAEWVERRLPVDLAPPSIATFVQGGTAE